MENIRDVDENPESEKPADPNRGEMAPMGPGSDINPHSLADIDSIQVDAFKFCILFCIFKLW